MLTKELNLHRKDAADDRKEAADSRAHTAENRTQTAQRHALYFNIINS
jgi:hypothetical protein